MAKSKVESVQNATPEELQALIKEAQERIEKLKHEEIEAKQRSIAEAVGRAGVDFEQKYGQYISHKNRDNEIAEKMVKLLTERTTVRQYLVDQRKPILDTLVGLGVKEQYVQEALGEAPKAPMTRAAGTGTKAKRTSVVYPDGSKHTWVDFAKAQGFTDDQLEGNSAKRVYLGKNQTLPSGYSEVEAT